MTNKDLATALAAVLEWQCPAHKLGTAVLLCCAAKALEHERKGEKWSPMGVAMEYAVKKHRTQRNVWNNMTEALRDAKGPKTPAAALRLIVEGGAARGKNVEAR